MRNANNPFVRYSSQLRGFAMLAVGIAGTLIIGGLIMGYFYPANVALKQKISPTPPEPIDYVTNDINTEQPYDIQKKEPQIFTKNFTGTVQALSMRTRSTSSSPSYLYAKNVSFVNGEAKNVPVSEMYYSENVGDVTIRILSVATSSLYKTYGNYSKETVGIVAQIEYMDATFTNLLINTVGENISLGASSDFDQFNLVEIETRDPFTWLVRYEDGTEQLYAVEGPVRHDDKASLTLLEESGSFKVSKPNAYYPLSFLYPREYSSRWSGTDEAGHVNASGVDAVYFEGSCDLESAMRDSFRSILNTVATITVGARPANGVVGITTTNYGYDPRKWGTVLRTVNVYDYVAGVVSGRQIPGRTVTLESIGGKKVRHILPFLPSRPCDTEYRERYQWISNGYLITLDVEYEKNDESTTPDTASTKEAVESIITSLTVVPE